MIRYSFILFMIFISPVFVANAATTKPNLINNPGFEQSFLSWDVNSVNGNGWAIVTDVVRVGNKSLFIRPLELTGQNGRPIEFFAAISQTVPVNVDDTRFFATIFAQTDLNPVYQGRVGLQLIYKDQNGDVMSTDQDLIGGQNSIWRKLHVEARRPADVVDPTDPNVLLVPTTLTYQLVVSFPRTDVISGAKVYFDQAVLKRTVLGGFQTTLLNNAFDNGLSDWNENFGLPGKAVAPGLKESLTITPPYKAVKSILKSNPVDQNYFSDLSQDIYFNRFGKLYPPDTFVNVTAKVKAKYDPEKRSSAGLGLEFINAKGVVIGRSVTNTGGKTLQYRDLYVSGKTPKGTKAIRVVASVFADKDAFASGGQAQFDDVIFSYQPLPNFPQLSQNLRNPSFENGFDDYWEEPFSGGSSIELSTVRKGNIAIRLDVTDLANVQDFFGAFEQTLSVTPGQTIKRARIFANADLKANSVGSFTLSFFDANGDEIISSRRSVQVFDQTLGWVELFFKNVFVPNGAQTMKFNCSLWAAQGASTNNNFIIFDNGAVIY